MTFWDYLKESLFGIKPKAKTVEPIEWPPAPKPKRKYGARVYGATNCVICGDMFIKRTPRHSVCDKSECKRAHKTALERVRRQKAKDQVVLDNFETAVRSMSRVG